MVEKDINSSGDIVDFACYQAERHATGNAFALPVRACRHCGAALLEGENEDDCSSAFNAEPAAQNARS